MSPTTSTSAAKSAPTAAAPSTKYRFVCYVEGCALTTCLKEDHSRHFNKDKKHPGVEFETKKVFKIAASDFRSKMNDEASEVATTPEEWLRARYPGWSKRKIARYIARHEPYKGNGRAPRKTATRKRKSASKK